MGSSSYDLDDDPSPLSSPLGPLSQSPQSDHFIRRLSTHTDDSMRYSAESVSSNFDHLSRSSLLDHDHGLGPSGLDRIRQQPSSRAFTLPNISASSLGPVASRSHSPSPRSASSSRAHPTRLFASDDIETLEDLHRFPCESLHSFSFAQKSEELLHNRHNILKRSIDFMRDRFGWATGNSPALAAVQGRAGGDSDTQSVVDISTRTNVLAKEDRYHFAGLTRGPQTGPANVDSDNIFERAFTEPQLAAGRFGEIPAEYGSMGAQLRYSGQGADDPRSQQEDEMRSHPSSRRVSIKKRTNTEIGSTAIRGKLMETLAPYTTTDPFSPTSSSTFGYGFPVPVLHTHSSKWTPASQAVFRTESQEPWTILAANDISCLIFGVTQGELRKLSILEVVQEDRRDWIESKLRDPCTEAAAKLKSSPDRTRSKPTNTKSMGMGNGVTAQLLSKPPSRARPPRRAQTDDGYGSSTRQLNHPPTKSRGVLLCGDVVPIKKRNGKTGSASIWVMEKRGGLIWVIEEIQEDVVTVTCNESWDIVKVDGDVDKIWGHGAVKPGERITELLPRLPEDCLAGSMRTGLTKVAETKYFASRTTAGICIPTIVTKGEGNRSLRISSFPHVAGMMVLSSSTLKIVSSNSVFSAALFGHERPEGLHINDLIPGFDDLLNVLVEEERVPLVDGIVIPEPSFRRARTLSILRDGGKAHVVSVLLEPSGLAATHRDGSSIAVDVQLRVAKSGTIFTKPRKESIEEVNESDSEHDAPIAVTELVYALWVTYSRHIHSAAPRSNIPSPLESVPSGAESPAAVLVSGTPTPISSPHPYINEPTSVESQIPTSTLSQQLSEAASQPLTDKPVQPVPEVRPSSAKETPKKRTIADYTILEEMGQGAYGEVKLARLKKIPTKKVVLKYVTKKRILVDTWTRDRRLGTVPLEIHVLDFLRRDGLKHPNIVEMEGFFEDDINYYIEMTPHGLPGMDLFDYIELKVNMDESECQNIFRQVVSAIHHLHTKALVVHRDIKDENVILDGEGRIKLIDFGSAAYIKNGPFDVFVGTIDYAAPEVLQGKSYRGKEQDIWALGILLYTIVYKENPFYNVDEILDHPLRVPFLPFSEDCIDLIRRMLDRDVDNRLTVSEVLEHPWMADN
ncbi:serine/threonine protein kinase [Aspergillus indologenus CBS 114.80]|uniref:non-specific serine/threonine protein kinase n=1 Tax=Aspergillus indologenus CBS 114.80 TaxID=1450541 RepID=A0A2V5I8C0_9EURO|nr:serine/threonine protein kinase [Aspergillus indologenus CBS 114.80]